MPPRRPKGPENPPQQVEDLLKQTDALCRESAGIREQAREGLVVHLQEEAGMLPVEEDQRRRARMARKSR